MLHGVVTGLQRIRTLETAEDGLHRLLVSFKDAKAYSIVLLIFLYNLNEASQMSLLEWSQELHDLVPVSLHTYERLPQIVSD
jgi:cleavage and polyadenylation specificity factor subunit 1